MDFPARRVDHTLVMDSSVTSKSVIAIVDDDESVREAMCGMVESFGYSVGLFESADEFLGSDRLGGTDCLILDVQMPGTSGLELHSRLISSGHRIPTIFVTAFPNPRVRDRAMQAGAVCFLSKPFARDDLFGCINAALGGCSSG
jgi:FixJ family two-component response regulator